ncbi:hypothetical protein HAX54_020034 [Datura stramonium]|uniref:Uncharacterized protein n=1 Tax=Datura stramonium TaxID=4076 RepID=A0ABS8USA4_DATST|nr:hypothetical protein [Datura stramonium]
MVPQWRQDSDSLEGQQYHFAEYAVGGTHVGVEGSRLYVLLVVVRVISSWIVLFKDRVVKAQLTGSVVGSSAPAGPSGPGEQLDRGQGRGEPAMPNYGYPHPCIFALDSQWVIEPPASSTSGVTLIEILVVWCCGLMLSQGWVRLVCQWARRRVEQPLELVCVA